MITPLFNGLRVEGGTFYTFQPSIKDMTLMFSNDSNIKMNFSKFVCLNLPQYGQMTKQTMYIDPKRLESINDNSSLDTPNIFFVKRYLQNYAENLNSVLSTNIEENNFSNTSEISLLKSFSSKINNDNPPIQFEKVDEYLDFNNVTRGIYQEVKDSDYSQVVQFIGDINLMNHVQKDGEEYVEIYAHIPTQSGKLIDTRFIKNLEIKPKNTQVPIDGGENWIVGQEYNFKNADSTKKTYARAVYDVANRYEVNKETDLLKIDWDDLENPNSSYKFDNGNFEFNAVLIYYDIFDKNDETTVSRNLYGILILDSFNLESPTSSTIKPFKKYQPNENQSGNSFGFRFNLMFNSNSSTVASSFIVNDYSTISMELYMEALEELKKVALTYSTNELEFIKAVNKVNYLEQLILQLTKFSGEAQLNEILSKINSFITFEEMTEYVNTQMGDWIDIETLNQNLSRYYDKTEVDNKIKEAKNYITLIDRITDKEVRLYIDDGNIVIETEN